MQKGRHATTAVGVNPVPSESAVKTLEGSGAYASPLADDLLVQEENRNAICRTISLLIRYLEDVGIPPQPSKTQYLCTCPQSDDPIQGGDAQVSMSPQINVLRQNLCTRIPKGGTLCFLEKLPIWEALSSASKHDS